MNTRRRIAAFLLMVVIPSGSAAHPMGNFSINHYSRIRVSANEIRVTTILDFAEISTLELVPDPRRAADHAGEWLSGLRLETDGDPAPLQLLDFRSEIVSPPSGLPTLRVQLESTAPWIAADAVLSFRDDNYPNRIGWKEVVIETGSGLTFPDGNPYGADRSGALTVYPDDLLSSAPDLVAAKVRVAPVGTTQPSANGLSRAEALLALAISVSALGLYLRRKELLN